VARNGPRDDFHNQPTQHADYGMGGNPPSGGPPPNASAPPGQFEQPLLDSLDQETEPTPWYHRPAMLIGWVLLVLVLLALIAFGIVELIHGDQGTSYTPSTSTTTPTTTTTPPTTTATTTPSTSNAAQPPPQQPTRQPTQQQPTQQQPTHRHHLPGLPSVITIPEVPTVITLPPGLP